ncbi:penicillin-binding protein 2 [Paenibacillus spiritus]|uniref:Penicillin-binding protein 2 n=1 Tax=Paenibacillus spiritus TaxID=2496557 RepID=A0A5J5GBJ2_9BACL|nr:penicillin-binding protein 2 [Paenibacillus spiritus]KAA9005371.1 penicillin-binding protein 2 [Paenibacillus spiritus]
MGQSERRHIAGLVILVGLVGLLAVRLAWVQFVLSRQVVPGGRYTLAKTAKVQSEREVVLDSGRGRLLDRSGRPLAGKTIWTAVFFPESGAAAGGPQGPDRAAADRKEALKRLAPLLGTTPAELEKRLAEEERPYVWREKGGRQPLALSPEQASAVRQTGFDGLAVLPWTRRYGGEPVGRQWQGYLSEAPRTDGRGADGGLRVPLNGSAGLERTLEPLLRGVGHTEVYARVDAEGKRIPGTGLTVRTPANPYYPLSLYTTIDLELQEEVERLARQAGVREGAVVVLDAATGDIAAMASLPLYNPNEVSPEGGEWNNRALQAAVPGSIFKIVTAAAALEAGLASPGEVFSCAPGQEKYGLKCPPSAGHGASMTLEQGFARSCNLVFAELADRLGGERLEAAALTLGLGRDIGWREPHALGLPELRPLGGEQAGRIFAAGSRRDAAACAQTAIGQRDAAVTPLQAANLVVTLLHGGEVTAPRILRRAVFASGQTLAELPRHGAPSPAGRISPRTASQVLRMMRAVVTEGTGRSLRGAAWPLAGKSGTAQTTVKGAPRNNQWFVGYGPADRPKYAAAVLVQNVAPDSPPAAAPLFGRIMDFLAEREKTAATAEV